MGGLTRRTAALLGALLVTGLAASPGHAGTAGTLRGTVVDSKTGEPIPAATVLIAGTRRGGVAGVDGIYQIPVVEAGTYDVTARATGHKPVTLTHITIVADFTTTTNFSLEPEAVLTPPVTVSGERPLIQRDATSTVRYKTGDEIQHLPTRGYQQVAQLQTGVAQLGSNRADTEPQNAPSLYIRGGRSNEVEYFVDGFSQRDPLTGIATTSINNNAIDQVVVLTGGFSAEYGRVMSGAVNVITREGTKDYHGSLEAVTDNLAGSWIKTGKYDNNIYAASLGGPLVPGSDNFTFYLSGERRWEGDRAPRPLTSDLRADLQAAGLPDDRLPNNWLDGWTGQAKLAFRPSQALNFKVGGIGSSDDWQRYQHAYLFDIAHTPRQADRNLNGFASLTHQLAGNTFHTLAVNYSYTGRKIGDGMYFDNILAYGRPNGDPRFTPELPYFQPGDDPTTPVVYDTTYNVVDGDTTGYILQVATGNEAHVWDDYTRHESSYWGGKYDLTSQFTRKHQLKVGGDFQYHTLRFYDHLFPSQMYYDATDSGLVLHNTTDVNYYGYDVLAQDHVNEGLNGAKHPVTASAYAQDKYESGGIVVNAGLRFDYLASRAPRLADEALPLGPNGDKPLSKEAGTLVDSKAYTRLSPRLGVGFPVTDRSVLHLNYGKFYQQPNLQDLYVNYDYLAYKVRVGGYFYPFGNPNLKPEQTTAYEVGVVHQLSDISRLDLTTYYKDIKDLVEVTTVTSKPSSFSSFKNRDYGTVKGLDVAYSLRPVHHLAADVAYSLSYATGTGSLSTSQRNIAWTSAQPPKQTAPLDFDQRHKIAANLDLREGPNEGPVIGGMHILANSGINLLFNAASGAPFTPTNAYDEVTLAAVFTVPAGPINSRQGPWRYQLDLKANKDFRVSGYGLSAYVWVINLLDRRNPTTVYTSTGSPFTSGWLNTAEGQEFIAVQGESGLALHQLAERNPDLFDVPRMVRFGLRADF